MNLLKNTVDQLLSLFSSKKKDADDDDLKGVAGFESAIGYRFKSKELLLRSLTHKSGVSADDRKGLFSNERLEFLGDAVLNCLVTEHLFKKYPDQAEGQLSKIKSLLVSRKIIGEVAKPIGLGKYLIMGNSERKCGGQKRTSIVSNTFEAILGAVYLDSGLDDVRKLLEKYLFGRIEDFLGDEDNVNYKSQILEMAQRDGFGIPNYVSISEEGPDHAKNFVVGIEIAGVRMGEGSGSNKKNAEQCAAFDATRHYNKENILSQSKGA